MNAPSIFPHSSLDGLLDALLDALRDVQDRRTGAAALKPVPVVVPSIQFTDWLQVSIARRTGLCMGFDFIMPQQFVERALARADEAAEHRENPWSPRNLTWLILPHMAEYAPHLGVTDATAPRDRLALADLLADQFDQYAHFRPQIIKSWSEGKCAAKKGWTQRDRDNERWQRDLWTRVQSDLGGDQPATRHPSLFPDQLLNDADFLESLRHTFPQLLVVGTGAFDPMLVRVLKLLERAGSEVRAHIALPSLGYLGGLRKSRRMDEQDPEAIEMRDGHPLLVSMGRHAVGSFLLLGELDENYTHWPEAEASGEGEAPSTLLRRIQSDIRELQPPAHSFHQAEGDISLRVHSCFGPRREIEVLRDELFRAFHDIKDLKPEEVIVVTPSLDIYAPLVSAVLDQTPALPVRLTERPPSEQDPAAEGLLALLEMAWSRCEASGLLALLHLRAVRACLDIADDPNALERLREWICASGLTCGLDEEAERCHITTGSWRFARDRLIAGSWFGDEERAQYPDGDYILPVADDLGGDFDLKNSFIRWLRTLGRTLREWSAAATPSAWAERLSTACDRLLSSDGDEDSRLEIQYALNALSQVACEELLDAAAISDWLQAASAETARRTPVSGRITFGRFKQLQNIPCRVLAMVGMQDGAFPRQNRVSAWDLLHCEPRAWDRNARIDDRQLFLDALLTPTDRLIITAGTRNVRSGRSEPFSSCVDELLRVAKATCRSGTNLVVEHRLQPFAPGYFQAGEGQPTLPRSFDARNAEVARSLVRTAIEDRKGLPFWEQSEPIKVATQDALELTIDQLVNFWKDPAKAFIRAQAIALPFDDGDDEDLDRSPLALDGLGEWSVRSAILEETTQAKSSMTYIKARLAADRGLPASELGNCKWETLFRLTEPLDRKLSAIKTGRLNPDLLVPTTPPVRITGGIVRGKLDDAEVLLACRPGAFKFAKHYLQPWIQAIAAACAGAALPTCLLDDENLEEPKYLGKFEPADAAELLQRLVTGYLEGQSRPLCYAPATSDAYAKACKNWAAQADADALTAASDKWNDEPFNGPKGEGFSEAAQLAWRDQEPFAHAPDWHRWAIEIASPLRTWFKA
jgi:exodeoxyribonuclease V gamma subunit